MTNENKPAETRPGMLGDGTEEQNLGQPGDPSARITKDDVEAAFAGSKKDKDASKGSVTDQVSNDLSTAKETPEDNVPKDNSHNFT